jgi:hypothetical protein
MNTNIDSLNREFALQNHLIFKQLPSGIVVAQIYIAIYSTKSIV